MRCQISECVFVSMFFSEHGSFSFLYNHGQETVSLGVCVQGQFSCGCRSVWTPPGSPGPGLTGRSWKKAAYTCLSQAAVFLRKSVFNSCREQSREQAGRRLKKVEIFVFCDGAVVHGVGGMSGGGTPRKRRPFGSWELCRQCF